MRATAHAWSNGAARIGALLTTYWGGSHIDDNLKMGGYVVLAMIASWVAFSLPEGVMDGGPVGHPEVGDGEKKGDALKGDAAEPKSYGATKVDDAKKEDAE